MKKQTTPNSHPLRKQAESKGFALMLSGSYVLTELDSHAWQSLKSTDTQKITFSDELSVIVVTNANIKIKRGRLARLAFLSRDGQFAQYIDPNCPNRSSVISLPLINAKAYTPKNFLTLIQGGRTLHIERRHDAKKWVGVLFGSVNDYYSSLVVAAGTPPGFEFVDIEVKPNRYNWDIRVKILSGLPKGVPVRAKTLKRYGLF